MDEMILKKRFIHACGACLIVLLIVVAAVWIQGLNKASNNNLQNEEADYVSFEEDIALDLETSYVQGLWQRLSSGQNEHEALSNMGFEVFSADDFSKTSSDTPSDSSADASSNEDGIPYWFQTEIADLSQGSRLVIDSTGALANVLISGDVDSVKEYMNVQLVNRGWIELNSSDQQTNIQSTYTKEEGDCRWITISMLQVGEEVSVTLHIQHV